MKYAILIIVSVLTMLLFSATALADWPSGAQGDQYAAANTAMENAVAGVGMTPETFVDIYNAAVAGNVGAYSSAQLDGACEVLSSLSSYTSVLSDYNTVYNNLGCSNRLAAASTRGALPSTGIAIALLVGSGVVGIGAAAQLLRRSR
ncbi:MAG: hypothetical protein C4534_04710 [Gaiellales bacterium]|nr:MAG: hypothetical protein C4534_04710 [Gaiellales bacterium]